ncbi:hypothetical protein JTE90_023328 [Oedothorax gibbosus]|uniref:Uncharacterized protein n=1 Tax=Oedothorax gibbosus TaxID=931172 RepID=A0AAV6VHI1_9ARAC|nr:hypothetical protein JTE90_023328 [Oedothorax gibbosus]
MGQISRYLYSVRSGGFVEVYVLVVPQFELQFTTKDRSQASISTEQVIPELGVLLKSQRMVGLKFFERACRVGVSTSSALKTTDCQKVHCSEFNFIMYC